MDQDTLRQQLYAANENRAAEPGSQPPAPPAAAKPEPTDAK